MNQNWIMKFVSMPSRTELSTFIPQCPILSSRRCELTQMWNVWRLCCKLDVNWLEEDISTGTNINSSEHSSMLLSFLYPVKIRDLLHLYTITLVIVLKSDVSISACKIVLPFFKCLRYCKVMELAKVVRALHTNLNDLCHLLSVIFIRL